MSVDALQGRLPGSLLVHTGTPVTYTEPQTSPAEWIEGEAGEEGGGEPTSGEAFGCVLFMPAAGGEQASSSRSRVVTAPTLLYNPTRTLARAGLVADGSVIVLDAEDEVMIDAPELELVLGVNPSRWLVNGRPQPFGPPGMVVGVQAALEQVTD